MGVIHTKICTNENYPLYGCYVSPTGAEDPVGVYLVVTSMPDQHEVSL